MPSGYAYGSAWYRSGFSCLPHGRALKPGAGSAHVVGILESVGLRQAPVTVGGRFTGPDPHRFRIRHLVREPQHPAFDCVPGVADTSVRGCERLLTHRGHDRHRRGRTEYRRPHHAGVPAGDDRCGRHGTRVAGAPRPAGYTSGPVPSCRSSGRHSVEDHERQERSSVGPPLTDGEQVTGESRPSSTTQRANFPWSTVRPARPLTGGRPRAEGPVGDGDASMDDAGGDRHEDDHQRRGGRLAV